MCVYTCQNATLLEITCRGSFSEQSTLVGEVGLHSHMICPAFPIVGGCDTWISVYIYLVDILHFFYQKSITGQCNDDLAPYNAQKVRSPTTNRGLPYN